MLCWQLFIPRYKSQTRQQNLSSVNVNCVRQDSKTELKFLPLHLNLYQHMWGKKRLHEVFAR